MGRRVWVGGGGGGGHNARAVAKPRRIRMPLAMGVVVHVQVCKQCRHIYVASRAEACCGASSAQPGCVWLKLHVQPCCHPTGRAGGGGALRTARR